MPATLLRLSDGHYSLEFAATDAALLMTLIRQAYGAPDIRRYPACTSYHFGRSHFTFADDWNEPCLISSSAEGDAILQLLHDGLNAFA